MMKKLAVSFLLILSLIIFINGCGNGETHGQKKEIIPDAVTSIKALSNDEAVQTTEDYINSKYPNRQESFKANNAILRPSGIWQIYVRSGDTRDVVCVDTAGTASGLFDTSSLCT